MARARHTTLLVALLLLVVTAGCAGPDLRTSDSTTSMASVDRHGPTAESTATEDRPATPEHRTATTTPTELDGRANCSDDLYVSFWGLSEPRFWDADRVRFDASVPGNASYLFVAYVDGTPHGVKTMSTLENDGGVHVDGGAIRLDGTLQGEHTLRIVVHRDADRNGAFDPGTDQPCYASGGLVQTSLYVVDFSSVSGSP